MEIPLFLNSDDTLALSSGALARFFPEAEDDMLASMVARGLLLATFIESTLGHACEIPVTSFNYSIPLILSQRSGILPCGGTMLLKRCFRTTTVLWFRYRICHLTNGGL